MPEHSNTSSEFGPKDVGAHELLASAQADIRCGAFDQALLKLQHAVATPNPLPEAIALAARLYACRKMYVEAQSHYRRYLEMVPDAIVELFEFGMTYRDTGQPEQALEIWGKVLERDRHFAPALLYRSLVFTRRGDIQLAKNDLATLASVPNLDGYVAECARQLQNEIDARRTEAQPDVNPSSAHHPESRFGKVLFQKQFT